MAGIKVEEQELSLMTDQPVISSPSQEGRYLAMVMVAGFHSFSALAGRLDEHAGRELIKHVWNKVDGVIHQHGGRLVIHIGDRLVAVWGIPTAGVDDAEQAVKTALELKEALGLMTGSRQPGSEQIQLQIGLECGAVLFVYNETLKENTLIGDVVNIAWRLEESARAGEVVIGESIFRQVRGAFQVQRLEPLSLIEKDGTAHPSEPIQPFVVEKAQAATGRVRYGGVDNLRTNMVGRDNEIAQLQAVYEGSQLEAIPTLVIVTGEEGIGKSRLLREFSNHLEANNPAFYLMTARALAQTARVPFYLWKMVWFNRFGLQADDLPQAASAKFMREVQKVWGQQLGMVPSVEAVQMVSSLVGLEWPGSTYLERFAQNPLGRVERAYDLNRELLCRITVARSTALVLDDLQWGDEDSLDLLMHLFKQPLADSSALPLFVLAGARPEFLEQKPRLAEIAHIIRLGALPKTAETVAAAYPGLVTLPDPVLTSLAGYSEGNPYFLEEIIRTLLGFEEEVTESMIYEKLALMRAQPPESLRAILLSRLEGLSQAARATIMLASVVGRVFWVGIIEAAVRAFEGKQTDQSLTLPSTLGIEAIQEGLRQLVKAEMAFPRANSTYSSLQEYIFKHDVLREIAYSRIPTLLKNSYHLAIAQWLASQSDPDFKIMAADHYEIIGAYPEAVQTCEDAAGSYQLRGANGEAQMLLERARMIRNRGVQK